MPTFGGYAPFPSKLGGSGPSLVEGLTQAMNESRGTAYDTSQESPVWVENHAIARCLASVWATNERLAKVFDLRSTSVLERWEAIFGLSAMSGDTLVARHERLAERRRRTGFVPTRQAITDGLAPLLSPIPFAVSRPSWNDPNLVESHPATWLVLSSVVGAPKPTLSGEVTVDTDVTIVMTTAGTQATAQATVEWVAAGAHGVAIVATSAPATLGETGLTLTFPAGTYGVNTHYTSSALVDGWSSSLAHVEVLTTPPAWMSDATYLDIATRAYGYLDTVLPAWVTFSVVRSDFFRLDVPQNLDNLKLA